MPASDGCIVGASPSNILYFCVSPVITWFVVVVVAFAIEVDDEGSSSSMINLFFKAILLTVDPIHGEIIDIDTVKQTQTQTQKHRRIPGFIIRIWLET